MDISMYKLNIFLIQKKYNKTEKELIINVCNEGIKIDSDYKIVYNMKNDKVTGEYREWHVNGQLWLKCYYKNDKRNDECLEWYYDSRLMKKRYYKNDKLTGEFLLFYRNGQLWEKCYYKNGKLTGEYREWYENGQIWEKRYYKNDKLIYKIIKNHRLHL